MSQQKSLCSKMIREINRLKNQTNEKMLKKFGSVIDFDEMEESVLKKMLLNQSKNLKKKENSDAELQVIIIAIF